LSAHIDGENRDALALGAAHFRRVLDVNVIGAFLVARAAARAMDRGSAMVVNASVTTGPPRTSSVDLNVSRSAAVSVARSPALELADGDIAVSAICPPSVATHATSGWLAGLPAERSSEPEHVARLVTFLLAPGAEYPAGSVIPVG
jgi:NAD(P)-dependent dehydrogenase (short-subunit alcohol dehydrogenase family)